MKLKNRFIIIIIIIINSCNTEKKCNYNFVEGHYGDYSYSGTLLNDSIRVGIWNFYSQNGNYIDSIVEYQLGSVKKTTGVYNGLIYFYRTADSFYFNPSLLKESKDFIISGDTSNIENGRRIYIKSCLSCHYAQNTSDLKFNNKIDSLIENVNSSIYSVDGIDWKVIKGYNEHLDIGILSKKEVEALKIFLESDQIIRKYN